MGRVKFLSISLLGFLFPNAGFPRVESEQQQASSAEGIIPPPLSRLGIGFWYKFVPPSNGCSAFYQYPFSPPKTVKKRRRSSAPLPQKIPRKIFGKVTISVIFSVL